MTAVDLMAHLQHVELSLKVRFDHRVFEGCAELTFDTDGPTVVLCTDLVVMYLRDALTGNLIVYQQGHLFESGEQTLAFSVPRSRHVRIGYQTSKTALDIQWLTIEQTLGQRKPLVFTNVPLQRPSCLFPCQHDSQISCTLTAEWHLPDWASAFMAGERMSRRVYQRGWVTERWEMEEPRPVTEVGLAIGAISEHALSDRLTVCTETDALAQVTNQFQYLVESKSDEEDLFAGRPWRMLELLNVPRAQMQTGLRHPTMIFLTPTHSLRRHAPSLPQPPVRVFFARLH